MLHKHADEPETNHDANLDAILCSRPSQGEVPDGGASADGRGLLTVGPLLDAFLDLVGQPGQGDQVVAVARRLRNGLHGLEGRASGSRLRLRLESPTRYV